MKKTRSLLLACAFAGAFSAYGADNAAADNTAKNERDRSGESLTSGDQSNKPADIKIAADTRRAVVGDDNLSMAAKNCKIIAIDGAVTLRGPVGSDQEKEKIASYATQAGATKVTNELEVKAENSN